ncbi:MAG: thioredoxin [Parachlamydiaceae bacterium]
MGQSIKYLNDENFQSEIATGVTLVDFYADWCGPCRMIAPIIEELAVELNGSVSVAKLDIENNQKVTSEYGITSIPTIIIYKDGEEKKRIVGLKDKETLKTLVNSISNG